MGLAAGSVPPRRPRRARARSRSAAHPPRRRRTTPPASQTPPGRRRSSQRRGPRRRRRAPGRRAGLGTRSPPEPDSPQAAGRPGTQTPNHLHGRWPAPTHSERLPVIADKLPALRHHELITPDPGVSDRRAVRARLGEHPAAVGGEQQPDSPADQMDAPLISLDQRPHTGNRRPSIGPTGNSRRHTSSARPTCASRPNPTSVVTLGSHQSQLTTTRSPPVETASRGPTVPCTSTRPQALPLTAPCRSGQSPPGRA